MANAASINIPRSAIRRVTGSFRRLRPADAVLRFNLNDEIIYRQGKGREWPHPQEWLKRTMGNDWIYYSTGGYTGVFEAIGEYYLPNTPYPTNSLLGGRPFLLPAVSSMIDSWPSLLREAADRLGAAPAGIRDFLTRALANDPESAAGKGRGLRQITGGRVTVLPPDARHVDYDVIPLAIAEGCLYKCRFCRVKSNRPFREKSRAEIDLPDQRPAGAGTAATSATTILSSWASMTPCAPARI